LANPFYVNPRYQDNIEKPTDFIMVKVVLFEEYERLREALEKVNDRLHGGLTKTIVEQALSRTKEILGEVDGEKSNE